MPIARTNYAPCGNINSQTSAFVATAGRSLLVIQRAGEIQPGTSCSDTAGNVFTNRGRFRSVNSDGSENSFVDLSVWTATNILGHATNVVASAFNGGGDWCVAVEYSGVDRVDPVIFIQSSPKHFPAAPLAIVSSHTKSLVVTVFSEDANGVYVAPAGGWSLISGAIGDGVNTFGGLADQLPASPLSAANVEWATLGGAFLHTLVIGLRSDEKDDPRKVGRIVAVRGTGTPRAGQLRPARITAVGAGTNVNAKALHATGETYTNLPRWSRSTPSTLGWVKT